MRGPLTRPSPGMDDKKLSCDCSSDAPCQTERSIGDGGEQRRRRKRRRRRVLGAASAGSAVALLFACPPAVASPTKERERAAASSLLLKRPPPERRRISSGLVRPLEPFFLDASETENSFDDYNDNNDNESLQKEGLWRKRSRQRRRRDQRFTNSDKLTNNDDAVWPPAPTTTPPSPAPMTSTPTLDPTAGPTTAPATSAPTTSAPAVAPTAPQPTEGTTAPPPPPATALLTVSPTVSPEYIPSGASRDFDPPSSSPPTLAPVSTRTNPSGGGGGSEEGGRLSNGSYDEDEEPTPPPVHSDDGGNGGEFDLVQLNVARPLPPAVLTLTFPPGVSIGGGGGSRRRWLQEADDTIATSSSSGVSFVDPALLAAELDGVLTTYLSARLWRILDGDPAFGDTEGGGGLLGDINERDGAVGYLEFSHIELDVLTSSPPSTAAAVARARAQEGVVVGSGGDGGDGGGGRRRKMDLFQPPSRRRSLRGYRAATFVETETGIRTRIRRLTEDLFAPKRRATEDDAAGGDWSFVSHQSSEHLFNVDQHPATPTIGGDGGNGRGPADIVAVRTGAGATAVANSNSTAGGETNTASAGDNAGESDTADVGDSNNINPSAAFDLAGSATLLYTTPTPVTLPSGGLLGSAVNESLIEAFSPDNEEELLAYIRERSEMEALRTVIGASVRVEGTTDDNGGGGGGGNVPPGGDPNGPPGGDETGAGGDVGASIREQGGASGRREPTLWEKIIAYVLIAVGALGILGYMYVFYHRRKILNRRKRERKRRAEAARAAQMNGAVCSDPLGGRIPSIVRTNSDDNSVRTYGAGSGNPHIDGPNEKKSALMGGSSVLNRLSLPDMPSMLSSPPSSVVGGGPVAAPMTGDGSRVGGAGSDEDSFDSFEDEAVVANASDDDSFARELQSAAGVDRRAWAELEKRKRNAPAFRQQSLEVDTRAANAQNPWLARNGKGSGQAAVQAFSPFNDESSSSASGYGSENNSAGQSSNGEDDRFDNDDSSSTTSNASNVPSSSDEESPVNASGTDPAMYYPAKRMMGMGMGIVDPLMGGGAGDPAMMSAAGAAGGGGGARGGVVGAGGYVSHEMHIHPITEGEDESSAVSSQPSKSMESLSLPGDDGSAPTTSRSPSSQVENSTSSSQPSKSSLESGYKGDEVGSNATSTSNPSSRSSSSVEGSTPADVALAGAVAAAGIGITSSDEAEHNLNKYLGTASPSDEAVDHRETIEGGGGGSGNLARKTAFEGGELLPPRASPPVLAQASTGMISPSTIYSDPSIQAYSSSEKFTSPDNESDNNNAAPRGILRSSGGQRTAVAAARTKRRRSKSPPSFSAFSDPSLVAYSSDGASISEGGGGGADALKSSAVMDKNLRMASATALAAPGGNGGDVTGGEKPLSPAYLAGWHNLEAGSHGEEAQADSSSSMASSSERSPSSSSSSSQSQPTTDVGVRRSSNSSSGGRDRLSRRGVSTLLAAADPRVRGLPKMDDDSTDAEESDRELLLEDSSGMMHFVPALHPTSSGSPSQSTVGETDGSHAAPVAASFEASPARGYESSRRESDTDGNYVAEAAVVNDLRQVSQFLQRYEESKGVLGPYETDASVSGTSDEDVSKTLEELHRLSAMVESGRLGLHSAILPPSVSESDDNSDFLQSEEEFYYGSEAGSTRALQVDSSGGNGDATLLRKTSDYESDGDSTRISHVVDSPSRASSGNVSGSRLGIVPFAVAKKMDSDETPPDDNAPALVSPDSVGEEESQRGGFASSTRSADWAGQRPRARSQEEGFQAEDGKPPRANDKGKKKRQKSPRRSLLSKLRRSEAMLDTEGQPSSVATLDGLGGSQTTLPPPLDVSVANEETLASNNSFEREGKDRKKESLGGSLVRRSKDLIAIFESRRSPTSGPIMPPNENWQYSS